MRVTVLIFVTRIANRMMIFLFVLFAEIHALVLASSSAEGIAAQDLVIPHQRESKIMEKSQ